MPSDSGWELGSTTPRHMVLQNLFLRSKQNLPLEATCFLLPVQRLKCVFNLLQLMQFFFFYIPIS